jgi:crossover junction endodeoxyribonuclease RuvC
MVQRLLALPRAPAQDAADALAAALCRAHQGALANLGSSRARGRARAGGRGGRFVLRGAR